MNDPRLTEAAKADLEGIWARIASSGDERSADRMIRSILETCRLRAQFPESGRARNELGAGLRSFLVRPYVIFYRPEEETILVLRILHGRRDLKRGLEDPSG